jgi:hypothetical protein
MRDKSKVNFAGQLKPETAAKLKVISDDQRLSQIKTIEFLIENWDKPRTYSTTTTPIKNIETPKSKPAQKVKSEEPTLAELWALAKKNKKKYTIITTLDFFIITFV